MAKSRMFSKRLMESARFLKMPASTQCLYFHLGLNADDDGIVEAYNVMQLIKATEDDLKVLVSKGFVIVLNEDLVTYITDWTENNNIRADRKIDSIYKDLLLQVLPDVQLLEKRERADVKKKVVKNGQPMDNQWTTNGRPMDCIGKDRLDKDNIDIYNDSFITEKAEKKTKTNFQEIVDKYNEICKSFSKVIKLTDARKKSIKARLDTYSKEEIIKVFEKAEQSNFLKGANNRNWKADFDWLMSDRNMAKVLEGKYDNSNALKDNNSNNATVNNNRTYTPNTKNQFNNFEQRNYSDEELDELERKLLSR